MKKIHMVDVVSQYQNYALEINKKITDVLNSGIYIQGDEVKNFELLLAKYLKSKHTISCGNGTDALYVALMSLDFNRGDEILVPSFTFVSSVEAICLLGLTPVFVDINPDTFLLNPNLLEKHISNKTKAIMPVHLFGQCCDMKYINDIARKHNLFVIEDAAQSIGATCNINNNIKYAGTIGHIGITSFYPSKNLGAFGDGGALFTQNKKIADKIRLIVNHGQLKKYYHKVIGLNSRLDAIQAAILSFKLSLLNKLNKQRKQVATYYNERLASLDWLQTPQETPNSTHVYHQYSILLSNKINRNRFQKYLSSKGIPSMIYYPIPLHKQQAYKSYSNYPLPISEKISKQIISLPICPELELTQINFICDVIKKYSLR